MRISKTKVVLQYRENNTGYFNENYMPFVDIDSASGGYPYATNIAQAYDFKTVEAAKMYDYKDEFDVRILSINYEY